MNLDFFRLCDIRANVGNRVKGCSSAVSEGSCCTTKKHQKTKQNKKSQHANELEQSVTWSRQLVH